MFVYQDVVNNVSNLKHILDTNGFVILDSISYGNKYHKSKQDYHLYSLLSGKKNNGLVDDDSMCWQPYKFPTPKMNNNHSKSTPNEKRQRRMSSSKPKQYFSTNINLNILLSIQQDILHYSKQLQLPTDSLQINATVDIMLEGFFQDIFHFSMDEGYKTIYPFFPNNEEYNIQIMKVSLHYLSFI